MQMFQELIRYADTLEESKLHIPVNVIMDEFATNTFIAGFEEDGKDFLQIFGHLLTSFLACFAGVACR